MWNACHTMPGLRCRVFSLIGPNGQRPLASIGHDMPWPLMGTEALQGLAEAADKSLQVAWFQDQETGGLFLIPENRFDIIFIYIYIIINTFFDCWHDFQYIAGRFVWCYVTFSSFRPDRAVEQNQIHEMFHSLIINKSLASQWPLLLCQALLAAPPTDAGEDQAWWTCLDDRNCVLLGACTLLWTANSCTVICTQYANIKTFIQEFTHVVMKA